MNTQLLLFYKGSSPDIAGRYINEILEWDFNKLEKVHDYIQWLFPLSTASNYNKDAPLLDEETIEAFKQSNSLRLGLFHSLCTMLNFFGLTYTSYGDGLVICKASNYDERKSNWQDLFEREGKKYLNHNLLRLSRVIESTRILGLPEYSLALYKCLEEIQKEEPDKIPEKTLEYWRQAAGLS